MINTDGSFSRITRKLKKCISLHGLLGKSVTVICASEGSYNRIPGSVYKNTLRVLWGVRDFVH